MLKSIRFVPRVDYTDVLGRSRKCLKKDLPKLQSLDKSIIQEVPSSNQGTVPLNSANQQASTTHSTPDLLSEDMRREMLRQKWEEEQRQMLENQDTVHYSNVQFDGQLIICIMLIHFST